MFLLVACSGSSSNDSGPSTPVADSSVDATETWIINYTAEQSGFIFNEASNQGVVTNVQRSLDETGTEYLRVVSAGIPDYQVSMSQALLDNLAERPNAATDLPLAALPP